MSLLLIHAIYHPSGGRNLCHCPNAHRTKPSHLVCLSLNSYTTISNEQITSNKNVICNNITSLLHPSFILCLSPLSLSIQCHRHIYQPEKSHGMLSSHGDFKFFVLSHLRIKSVSGLSMSQLSEINRGYQYRSPDIIILLLFN